MKGDKKREMTKGGEGLLNCYKTDETKTQLMNGNGQQKSAVCVTTSR